MVQTREPRAAAAGTIVLTNAGNDLGTGLATLQVRDAGGGTSVSADVQFTTAGAMPSAAGGCGDGGERDAGGDGRLTRRRISVGIRGNVLTVVSAGDVTLTKPRTTRSRRAFGG